jgi:A/G-specific adenine glycosylase
MAKRNGRFPKDREQIESLPGIGQYIASAVLLFYHSQPEPLIDANVARVLERVYGPRRLADIRYDSYLQSLAKRVVGCAKAKEMNWAILDLAALVCAVRKPRCNVCPLAELCSYKASLREDLVHIEKSKI